MGWTCRIVCHRQQLQLQRARVCMCKRGADNDRAELKSERPHNSIRSDYQPARRLLLTDRPREFRATRWFCFHQSHSFGGGGGHSALTDMMIEPGSPSYVLLDILVLLSAGRPSNQTRDEHERPSRLVSFRSVPFRSPTN